LARPLVAGNWKMNGTLAEAADLVHGLLAGSDRLSNAVDLVVIPPFTALVEMKRLLGWAHSAIAVGAQDLHWEQAGAYTGEISAEMLREAGAAYVLVGHSERRTQFGETGDVLLRKLRAALRVSLVPILCIGEDLGQRESGQTEAVLGKQLGETLLHLPAKDARRSVVAYEPVWAIGTGRTATPEQAEEAHRWIREQIAAAFGKRLAGSIRILYGGSVKPGNAGSLLQRPGIDGALVGGCSLRAGDFIGIAEAAV
jgi:triosephosphate isomerase